MRAAAIAERSAHTVVSSEPFRVARLTAPREWNIERASIPTLGTDEVLVRLEGCGVCGSNLPVWQGQPWFEYPLETGAPGHEGWGRVAAAGEDVAEMRVGERVAVLSYHAFAEYDIAPASHCVPLPPELAGAPFPGEALACALNVFRRSEIVSGQSVAVVGIGFLGALLVQLAARAGARVMAGSRRRAALEVASRFGAESLAAWDDLKAYAGKFDCVIEAAGAQATLDVAARLTAVRGRLVIAGYHQDGDRLVEMQDWNWKGIDVINAHERDPGTYLEGMREAARLSAAGQFDPTPLYTHAFSLGDIQEAFQAAELRPGNFMKAIVRV